MKTKQSKLENKSAQILRRAGQLLELELKEYEASRRTKYLPIEFACHAIGMAAKEINGRSGSWALCGIRQERFFRKVLQPKGCHHGAWYSDRLFLTCAQNQNARIFGLYLCALLAEEGFVVGD